MKSMEKLRKKKTDNKGFSLVELIIVIAIMAILVGIVGTQVVPYLSRSRAGKDQQLLNSFSTAAVSGYAYAAEAMPTTGTLTVNYFNGGYAAGTAEQAIIDQMVPLTGYSADTAGLTALTGQMSSDYGQNASQISLNFDFDNHTLTVHMTSTGDARYPVADVVSSL